MAEIQRAGHIRIEEAGSRVTVRFHGATVADSTRALRLLEGSYAPVLYVPREDVDLALLEPVERTTHCPHKGDASYWRIRAGGAVSEPAVWSYETPLDQVSSIGGHMAFYPDRVDVLEVSPG